MISVSKGLLLPICSLDSCSVAVEPKHVQRHLRQTHNWDSLAASAKCAQLQKELSEVDESEHLPLRQNYLKTALAPNDVHVQPLPVISDLKVYDGLQCSFCSFISLQSATIKKHMSHCPRIVSGKSKQSTSAPVRCQTLFGGNKTRFFPILEVQSSHSQLLRSILRLEGTRPSACRPETVRHMDAFLSQTRFDDHLEVRGISLEQAFQLVRWDSDDLSKSLRSLISKYIETAFQKTRISFYIRSHRFMDKPMSLSVEKETLRKYEFRATRLLLFLTRVSTDSSFEHLLPFVPPQVRKAVIELQRVMSKDVEQSLCIVHNILSTAFLSPLSDEQDILPIFISCTSVFCHYKTTSYRFGTASEVSPILAGLKYIIRAFVVTDVYIYSSHDSAKRWLVIDTATSARTDTGITYVSHCMAICHGVMSGESHHVRFIVCRQHPSCGILDGHELSLSDLKIAVRSLQSRAWALLTDKILHGLQITSEFWDACATLQDSLQDRTTGYWFGMHPANYAILSLWRERFLHCLTPYLITEDGDRREAKARRLISSCEDLQAILYVLLQVCSGSPARATEIGVIQVRNTAQAARHVYISSGQLFTITSYHKSRAMTEGTGKPIPRFPDAVTAGLFLVYLLIVKPIQVALIQEVYSSRDNPQPGNDCADFLFTLSSTPALPDQLRSWFSSCMKSAGIPFGTNQYRQYHAGMVKHFIGSDSDTSENNMELATVLQLQAGHSVRTAHRVYGVSSLDMRELTGTELQNYRSGSEAWHNAIGAPHGPADAMSSNVSRESLTTAAALPSPSAAGPKLPELESKLLARLNNVENLLNRILEHMEVSEHTTDRKRALLSREEQSNECHSKRFKIAPFPSSQSCIQALRSFLGSDQATFRSAEQEIAVVSAIKANEDMLVILPTGYGKSLLFMLPAFMFPDRIVIVIVPLIALQKDIIRRCSEKGVQAVLWSQRDTAGARVVIASVEHIVEESYRVFVSEKHALQQLHAIYVDEAHLNLLWLPFRNVLNEFSRKVRPSGVRCSIIGLTASAPPHCTESIAQSCGMTDFKVIRMNTMRSNLRYAVKDCSEQKLKMTVVDVISHLLDKYQGDVAHFIVYTRTRKECENIASILNLMCDWIPTSIFHGGLTADTKQQAYDTWLRTSDTRHKIMVATSAFGCGLDIPTVRAVVHVPKPRTLVEYVQESGRAGRDGKPSDCIVINITAPTDLDKNGIPLSESLPFATNSPLSDDQQTEGDLRDKFGDTSEFQQNSKQCRRTMMHTFIDGVSSDHRCTAHMELCDVCAKTSPAPAINHCPPSSHSGQRDTSPQHQSFPSVPTVAGTVSSEQPANANDLKTLSVLLKNICPVCSMQQKKKVAHSSDISSFCYKGRCLRCGLKGHNASNCGLICKSDSGSGCFACSIKNVQGEPVHAEGTYGKSSCLIKRLLSIAILAWDTEGIRNDMHSAFPRLRAIDTTSTFAAWLAGKLDSQNVGLCIILPWIVRNFLY